MEVIVPAYTDEEIRNMKKITCKIAGDYLGISPMALSIGMRNNLLPIGFAIHNEERDRVYSESWSYQIIAERLIAYKYGRTSEVQVLNIILLQKDLLHISMEGSQKFRFRILRRIYR